MGSVEKNIEYFTNISYPEYSKKASSTKRLDYKIEPQKDFGLLDLSLSQRDNIDKKIIDIINNDLISIGKYSYSQNNVLLDQLSKINHFPKQNNLITSGCDGALRVVSKLLISTGTRVCIPLPSFGRYEYHAKVNKAKIYFFKPSEFPYKVDTKNLVKYLSDNKIEVLYLANPNNPTGIYSEQEEITYLLQNFKGYCILDESLINPNTITSAKLIRDFPRLIIVRSFSKFYGLAGARVGYIIVADPLIRPLLNLISPFEVNSLALSLAIAVLKDKDFAELEAKVIREQMRKLIKVKNFNDKIRVTPSGSSLALIQSSGNESLYDLLLSKGIKTVDGKDFRGLENSNSVRICIKDADSIDYLISELKTI